MSLQDARADDGLVEDQMPVLRLPAVLDLKAAAPLAAMFLAHRGTDIIVDAVAVQRLGGQCLQILLSAQAGWTADALSMTIENPSAEFSAAIELFGVGPVLFCKSKELG